MKLKECLLIKNECYKYGDKMVGDPKGIVVHSTGANNPRLARYVQPISMQNNYMNILADLGQNIYSNDWNREGIKACVHAFIGKNIREEIETYQTLPYNICCWGCAYGSKGSYNYNPNAYLQFEICEDDLTNEQYFNSVMKEAQEYCAYLCRMFDIKVDKIVSHAEAHKLGYASNHADIDHWLKRFNKTMDWFRSEVQKMLDTPIQETKQYFYRVQVGAYNDYNNAIKMKEKLKEKGFDGFIVKAERN